MHTLRARSVSLALATTVAIALLTSTAFGQSAAQDEAIYDKFQEIIKLRADGDYDGAAAKLEDIIRDYAGLEAVLRLAYNHLVTTYIAKGDTDATLQAARTALARFPDLNAEEISFPPKVNEQYDELRKEMFGSLAITKPRDAQAFLNGALVGETPLQLDLVRTGSYSLTMSKDGYHEYEERIRIRPDVTLEKEVSMDRIRGWKWWTIRGGFLVGAAVLFAIGMSSGDDEPPPLDPPPAPPTN